MPRLRIKSFNKFRYGKLATCLLPFCASVLFVPPLQAASSQQWVSDHLSAYVRSGPTNGYRIVGALDAGTQVQVLSTQNDYSQIRTPSGDTVWIPTNQLQDQEGAVAQAKALSDKVNQLEAELHSGTNTIQQKADTLQQQVDGQTKYINELESTRTSLNQQLNDSQSQVRSLKAQLGNEHQLVLMHYLAYGGGIAVVGLILGLILPAITPRRKKRKYGSF